MRKSIVLIAAVLFAAAAATGPAVAKSKLSNISVTKQTDKASPTLYRANTAPRDAASGLATGKRMHKPVR
jgi:type VI protein secretion system component Hcp